MTSQGTFIPIVQTGNGAQSALQALDIFLVQANTNVLVAQFVPLVCNLFLQTQIPSSGGNNFNSSDLQIEKETIEKPEENGVASDSIIISK